MSFPRTPRICTLRRILRSPMQTSLPPPRHLSTRPALLASTTWSPPATPSSSPSASASASPTSRLSSKTHSFLTGLDDAVPPPSDTNPDWSRSFAGLSAAPFDADAQAALLAPLDAADVEVKPDGMLYLPEIKIRRILNRAFGPGAWGLAPRGPTLVGESIISREYALVVMGRLVSISRGEQQYFEAEGIPTATEGCKSNALMRCCKDLGVASELWDPTFIRDFKAQHVTELWVEHTVTKKKRKIFRRKDAHTVPYPWKVV